MTVKNDTRTYIGPVQFNWGYSLNKVELLEASITSHFSSGDNKSQGSMGKDYRVKYSLIAFSGVISGKRAEKTRLKPEDVDLLDRAMKNAITNLATRSKIGQYPRMYLRVEYNDNQTILGDLRDYINLKEKNQSIRDINECTIEIDKLVDILENNKERINKVYYYVDPSLRLTINDEVVNIQEGIQNISFEKIV